METNRSLIKYQQEIQTESAFVGLYVVATIISSTILTLILLLSYILQSSYMKKYISSRKELKKQSIKVSKIVNKDIKCYTLKNKEVSAFNIGEKDSYITTKLLGMLTEKEITAVFLHEYGHYQKSHILKSIGVQYTSSILISAVFNLVALLGVTPLMLFSLVLSMLFGKSLSDWYSKRKEFDADEIAVKHGYGKYLLSSLKKIERHTKQQVCKKLSKNDCELYFADLQKNSTTHPTYQKRYEKIMKSPYFSKLMISFASKISDSGYSISLINKIKSVIDGVVKKLFN